MLWSFFDISILRPLFFGECSSVRSYQRRSMIARKILAVFALLIFQVSGEEDSTSLSSFRGYILPKSSYEIDREAFGICNMVQGLFQDNADCVCDNKWLEGNFTFTCETRDPSCSQFESGKEDGGSYCAKTRMTGKLSFFFFQLKTTIQWEACQTEVWANNTVAGNVFLNELCLGLGLTGRLVGESGLSSCSGKIGGVTCTSCSPCTKVIEGQNRQGVTLDCNSLQVTPCFPAFGLDVFVMGKDDAALNPLDLFLDFDPFEALKEPGMEVAAKKLEEAIEDMNTRS